jgi:hypothetical protein
LENISRRTDRETPRAGNTMLSIAWDNAVMTRRTKLFLKAAAVCVAVYGAGYLLFAVYETHHFRKALPEILETSGLATTGSDLSLPVALLAFSREACGGAILTMTDTTRAAIEKDRLSFFAAASHARGYPPGDRLHRYYTYKPWTETPVPAEWTSEGIWIGLHCMKLSREMVTAIRKAALAPGSYYSTKDEAELLVIPSLGLIVFTYYG